MEITREWRRAFPWSLFWQPGVRSLWALTSKYVYEIGWIWPFMFSAGALLFTPMVELVKNPLLWRSFGNDDPFMAYMHAQYGISGGWNDYSNHHTLNLAAEALLCFGLAAWFSRTTRSQWWKWGLLATYGAVLTWCVHEGLWWLTYMVLWKPESLKVFSGFGEIITVGLLMFTPAIGLYAPKKYILWMLGFQLLWIAGGFPITESYLGNTSLYNDLGANAWEVASWVWACVGFFLLERKGLLAWFERIRSIALLGPVPSA